MCITIEWLLEIIAARVIRKRKIEEVAQSPGGRGGALGIFGVGMRRPGLQIGTPF